MPVEVSQALDILAICDRFHCLPSQALAESAGVFQLMEIERRVRGHGQ
jgi:hypothetical protein